MSHCLIVARSARALAESAQRAGYHVHAIDAFADSDTAAACQTSHRCDYLKNGFAPAKLAGLIEHLLEAYPIEQMIAGAGIEQQPALFERYQKSVQRCCNTAATVKTLVEPTQLVALLTKAQVPHPQLYTRLPASPSGYIAKQAGSMGGEQVAWASSGSLTGEGVYYQSFLAGDTRSVVFLADGSHVSTVGYNRQWQYNGNEQRPFLYAGASSIEPDAAHQQQINSMLEAIVAESGLQGLCGMDYIVDNNGDVTVLEVNPRSPATFELHEGNESLFAAHVRSFAKPVQAYERCHPHRACVIIYAEKRLQINRDFDWPVWTKDRPREGSIIHSCQPVCTVHAQADAVSELKQLIENRRQTMQMEIASLAMPV